MDKKEINQDLVDAFKPTKAGSPSSANFVEPNVVLETPSEPIKQHNPLQQYFRKPAIYIKLPSGGKFNAPGDIDIPENGELAVYPMTAKDEILLRTPDALMNGATTVQVIESCVPAVKNAWKVCSLDIDMLLISLRIASYGEITNVKGVCPDCGTEANYELDLRTITDKVGMAKFNSNLDLEGLKIKFAPLTYETATKEALKNFEQQRMVQSVTNDDSGQVEDRISRFQDAFVRLTMFSVAILAETIRSITTPEGTVVTDRDQISEFVANSDHKIFNAIKQHLETEKTNTTIPPLNFKCTGEIVMPDEEVGQGKPCTREWKQPFTIDNSSFFA